MKTKNYLCLMALLTLTSCNNTKVISEKAILKENNSLKEVESDPELYQNIFLEDRIPEQYENYGIGDPFIYRFNGMYYLLCSTKSTVMGVKAWKSKDLMHWEKVSNGVTKDGYIVATDCAEAYDAWASEMYYLDGTFYLCESQNGKGHYIFKSTSPEGPFELITPTTIDNTIDGSFTINTDGKMVLLSASASVTAKEFSDDMTSVSEGVSLKNTTMTGWTEGPLALTKDGTRFYIYTGNGVTQKAYRVDYSYTKATDNIFDDANNKQAHNIILNTDDDFYGLGHCTCFLGPDLDSYYMGYHSSYMEGNSGGRRFNLGRMLFNGNEINMQHIGLYNNIVPNLPDYQEFDSSNLETVNNFNLSTEATKDSFTVEYNFTGSEPLVFSYIDENNYNYLKFDGKTITINEISNGKESKVNEVNAFRNYKLDVMHSIRIGYKDSLMDVSFDGQEIANDIKVNNFKGGKVGYSNKLAYQGTLTFNNTAQGDSDKETPKQEIIPATSYSLEKSNLSSVSKVEETLDLFQNEIVDGSYQLSLNKPYDYATYLDYVSEEGSYGLDLVIPSTCFNKQVGVQVDGNDITKWTLPDYSDQLYEGYVRVKLADLYLTKGNHNITIYNIGDNISYQMMYLERNYSTAGTIYEEDLTSYPKLGINYPTFFNKDKEGFYSDNNARYLVTFGDGTLEDVKMSVDITLTGDNGVGTVGLVLASKKWAFNNLDLDNYKSIRGYYFALNSDKIEIIKSNYQYTDETCRDIAFFNNDEVIHMEAIKKGKVLTMYINGNKVLETFSALGEERGYCGIYANNTSARFNNLKIETL